MKPLHYRSVSSKGDGRPRLTHHHKDWWNGTKWMRRVWRNGGMKFVVGENAKNLPRPRFVHHETHMEGPRRELGTPAVGGERLTACATRPPRDSFISPKLVIYSWDMINLLNHRRLARWIKRRACDVGEAKEGFGEWTVTWVKQRMGWRMSCDVGKAWAKWSISVTSLFPRYLTIAYIYANWVF